MKLSPLLDTANLEPQRINPSWPVCPGYLDAVLSVFKRHRQPFVLVSTLAMRWSGARNIPQKEVDVLVRSSQLQVIVDDLIASGDWKISDNWVEYDGTMINHTAIRDVWLKSCWPDSFLEYLRFWPEELYKLSVTCNKVEVPDVFSREEVLLEEEYCRDLCERFGPQRLRHFSIPDRPLLPLIQMRAKIMEREIPIFIPTIEEHLNALLDQLREQRETKLFNGNAPQTQVRYFIRYLFLDWAPTRNWLLSSKIRERNLDLMTERLDNYWRKPLISYDAVNNCISSRMPWESPIRPEFKEFESVMLLNGS
jgi:hypothetical protein